MEKMFGSTVRWVVRVGSLAAAAALVACGGGGGGGDGLSGPPPQGTVSMSMTDAPACYESVVVTVEKVRLHMDDSTGTGSGWKEIVPPGGPVRVDLLNLTNGAIAELGSATVTAGTYTQVRLVLAETGNTVTPVGGTPQPLKTPSGQQSGLKINGDFTVPANATRNIVLDFDGCKSIVLTGAGTYLLKPVVRVSEKVDTGIQGYVSTALAAATVSAQQNGTVLRSTIPDATGKFKLAYLPAGTYTVVITADGAATGVVDSVPVGTSTTVINGTATAIVLPTSLMRTVTGTVTASSPSGTSTTATVPVSDALVSALQTLNARLIEVTSVRVDDLEGRYTLRLPAAAPQLAPYSASGLAFTAVPSAAGKYTLKASAEGRTELLKSVDVGGTSTATVTQDFKY